MAGRAGSAVEWRRDLAAAQAESERRGVPVFWYVPTIAGSPMDRRPEIDRYMMAGPFSHPDVVALLNTGFVPVRQNGGRKDQEEHGLRRGDFIEPGMLVLAPDGTEKLRAERIVTLHPKWFTARLAPLAAVVPEPRKLPEPLTRAWRAYGRGDLDEAAESLGDLPGAVVQSPAVTAEAGFLMGAILHRRGLITHAAESWREVADTYPDEPYAWKAAAEAEGHGPFARGFEDFLDLPADAMTGNLQTTRAPPDAYTEAQLRQRSLRFLTDLLPVNGQYDDSRYDFGGTDGLVNVYMAITSIAGLALLEELAANDFGGDRDACEAALQRIARHIADDAGINRDDRDEIVWAHIYRVLLLVRWLELRPNDEPQLRPVLQRVTRDLEELQPKTGAWFHEYPNPFVTASCLIALHRADAAGVPIDRDRIELGLRALLQCRAENGSFSYGQVRSGPPRVSVPAGAGRMPLCELALALWQKSTPETLEAAIRAGFDHHDQLESVRKYDDHANALGYGGFFFWYDVHGRTLAIAALRDPEVRRQFAARQREIILSIPEFDGCFVDSHELGRVYGTASALLCLVMLRSA